MKLTHTLVVLAAASLLGGCTQFTGSDDVTLDGDPITKNPKNPKVPVEIGEAPATTEIKCSYPIDVQFGTEEGNTVSSTTGDGWQGYAAGSTEPGAFPISNLYDCLGEEVHAIVVDTSQFG